MHFFTSGGYSNRVAAAVGMLAIVGLTLAPVGAFAAESGSQSGQNDSDAQKTGPGFHEHREIRDNEEHVDVNVCSSIVAPAAAHCDARLRTDTKSKTVKPARVGQAQPAGSVGNAGGYDPGYLQSAYNVASAIGSGAGSGQVIAIVDAYDDPNAQSDLAYYRSYFGLPALNACSSWPSPTACFRKVDQNGGTNYPTADVGWAEEISLDLDMASAMCPNCTILLVEANSASYTDLAAGVDRAVALGANVVSNSYGGSEFAGQTSVDSSFNHPGVAITVSSGDAGYGTEFPASSPYVTAVGGTSLNQATNTGSRSATETAWGSAGSGCSAIEPKPSWQTDTMCAKRTVADVSAVADPNTGVWVYDTYQDPGFRIFGGTSVAAPIVGAIYALAGNSISSTQQLNSDPYNHTSALFDVVSGSNGTCGGTYLCTSVVGYDGPTGLGTPNGTTAFTNASTTPPPAAPAPPAPVAPAADFKLTASSTSLTVTHGGASVADTLMVSAVNGYQSSVQLSVSGLPRGVTATFGTNPLSPGGSSRMTLRASSTAKPGTYTGTVTAAGADGTRHSLAVQIRVR